jgi:flagellar protein FlbD
MVNQFSADRGPWRPASRIKSDMIKLTRLDGERFALNAELIRYVEARPDTFITLTNGERLVVRESMDEVLHLAIDYQRSKNLFPPAAGRDSMPPATD